MIKVSTKNKKGTNNIREQGITKAQEIIKD